MSSICRASCLSKKTYVYYNGYLVYVDIYFHFSMLLWGQIDTNRCLVVLFGAFCEELTAGAADLDTACDA